MEKEKLRDYRMGNGLRVLHYLKDSEMVSAQVSVNVGSNHEQEKERGISHFLEHMVFEGTRKRSAHQIARGIEGIGGEIGAFTTNERTCFYVNCLSRFLGKAIEILADMLAFPALERKSIDKERQVIISEIRMREDEPRTYQWQLLLEQLFSRHPLRHPVIGYVPTVKSITSKELRQFHKGFYSPSNMVLSIVGGRFDEAEVLDPVKRIKRRPINKIGMPKEPKAERARKAAVIRDISQSYMVIGYKTPPRLSIESYHIDIIRAILGKGLSGRLFNEIRTKRGLAYNLGIHHEAKTDQGFLAYYISTEKSKLDLCEEIFLKEIKKLDSISQTEVKEAKNFIEGDFIMKNEDSHNLADSLGRWALYGNIDDFFSYVEKIGSSMKQDIIRTRDRFLRGAYAKAVIEQKSA